ncbi:hypothetical protein NB231_02213 [Nitrococcus mobilis Nb-231]|uniref:Uncharacterized protein n=1 Tax=Nitrococcus mobilis Nb-231 TaxID=314278 RepID=A4BUH9_9GAMM|nr:hypothetical protein NB231_02213 [Nitrococcus mobilis Nb-231]
MSLLGPHATLRAINRRSDLLRSSIRISCNAIDKQFLHITLHGVFHHRSLIHRPIRNTIQEKLAILDFDSIAINYDQPILPGYGGLRR